MNHHLKISDVYVRHHKKILFVCLIALFCTILNLSSVFAVTNITSCATQISTPDTYLLNASISGTANCINISGSHIVLDCRGFTINYGSGGTVGTNGIRISNSTTNLTNVTVQNCIIARTSNLLSNNYGIALLNTSNSTIFNNTIITNGTSNNYPIYISNSTNNTISTNNLSAVGTTGTNVGIYLDREITNSTFVSNNITTTGTTLNYGIFMTGTAARASNYNNFSYNTITTGGSGISNHGIYITTNANNNTLQYNNINVTSSGTSYGIYALGLAGFTAPTNSNLIDSNNITTSNSGSNIGIFLSTDSNYNNLTNNILSIKGTTANYGIEMLGVATGYCTNNLIQDNSIIVNGTAAASATNYGVFGTARVSSNLIDRNNITVYGNATGYPVYITGAAATPSFFNNITNNNLYAMGTGASNFGVYMLSNVGGFTISNNYIETRGTTLNHGILTTGLALNGPDNNTITYNTIRTNGTGVSNHGIYVNTNHYNNDVSYNNIIANGSTTTYGLIVVGAANANIGNSTFTNNNITVNSVTGGSSIGAYFSANILQNNITDNRIEVRGTTANIGLAIVGAAATPVNRNIVTRNYIFSNNTAGAAATSYGLQLSANANYNTVSYNNITTLGFTTNYGVYLLSAATTLSQYNVIDNNIINANGTGATNHGIIATTFWYYNNITNNLIYNAGTTGCFGINFVGAADITRPFNYYNIIENNTVNTTGTTTAYGLVLQTNSQTNIARNNAFHVTSGTTPTGLFIGGAASANSDSNIVSSNNFTVRGTLATSAAFGSLITSGVSRNQIINNSFYVEGASINYGVQLLSTAALDNMLNNLENNTIYVNSTGAGATDYGVYLFTNVNDNTVKNNDITVYGNTSTFGVYLSGATYPVARNQITNNRINVFNSTVASNTNVGVYLLTNANHNNISTNNMTVRGRTTDAGVYLSLANDNTVENNQITVLGTLNTSRGVYILSNSQANIIKGNTITGIDGDAIAFLTSAGEPESNVVKSNVLVNTLRFDVSFESGYIDNTQFINQQIANYNLSNLGINGTIFENTNYGKITFRDLINGTGTNLSADIIIGNQSIYINESRTGLNRSATLSFYNMPAYQSPIAYRNAIECAINFCTALSNIGSNIFTLSITGAGLYTLAETDVNVTLNAPAADSYFNEINSMTLNYTFLRSNNTSRNITAWLFGDGNLLNVTYNVTNNTEINYIWTSLALGTHNWSVTINDGSSNNLTTAYKYFTIVNLTINCEAAGPYQKDALVLIQGNVTDGVSAIQNAQINASVYRDGVFNGSSVVNSASDGKYFTSFSGLTPGNYSLNVSVTYQNITKSCTDTFFVGKNALLSLDKIISLVELNNSHLTYNITLKTTNFGGSTANSVNITDSDSVSSPFNLGDISVESFSLASYLISYARNSTTYNVTLANASVQGTDDFDSTLVEANSTQSTIIIPSTTTDTGLTLIKNIQFDSENITHINYNLSLTLLNSGGNDLDNIFVEDYDLSLSLTLALNRTQTYYSSSIITISKSSSNAEYNFSVANATSNSLTYYSNTLNIIIPRTTTAGNLYLQKSANVIASSMLNVTYNITLSLTNTGERILSNVELNDTNSTGSPYSIGTIMPGQTVLRNYNITLSKSELEQLFDLSRAYANGTDELSGIITTQSNIVTIIIPKVLQNASLIVHKSASLSSIESLNVTYNITLSLTNNGGRNATSVQITDDNSTSSPYAVGTLTAGQSYSTSYLLTFERQTLAQTHILSVATSSALDSFDSRAINVNSEAITISVPAIYVNQTPASFVLDKIVGVHNFSNSSIVYNITLRLSNKGGSSASGTNITDSDSAASPYSVGTLSTNSTTQYSYLKTYTRNSSTYFITLDTAQVVGQDSSTNSSIYSNSTVAIITIPSEELGQQIVIIKNIYFNSENSTAVNYSIGLTIVNSGGVDLTGITILDSDINLSTLINLNKSQVISISNSTIIDKAASNTQRTFVKSTATVNTQTFESNQAKITIPGYGGPADTIVYVPATVTASTSFNATIEIINQNADIGQNFIVDYWITNNNESTNYSAGQQTIYVGSLRSTNVTAILSAPSVAGTYRLRALTSYIGGPDFAFTSFQVVPAATSTASASASSGSQSGSGYIPAQVVNPADISTKKNDTKTVIANTTVSDAPHSQQNSTEKIENNSLTDDQNGLNTRKSETIWESLNTIKEKSLAAVRESIRVNLTLIYVVFILASIGITTYFILSLRKNMHRVTITAAITQIPALSEDGLHLGEVEHVLFSNNGRVRGWVVTLSDDLKEKLNVSTIHISTKQMRLINSKILIVKSSYLKKLNIKYEKLPSYAPDPEDHAK